jgi:hypothetical protein
MNVTMRSTYSRMTIEFWMKDMKTFLTTDNSSVIMENGDRNLRQTQIILFANNTNLNAKTLRVYSLLTFNRS